MSTIVDSARRIATILVNNNFEVLFTGAGVRDSILGKIPKSVEVITNASPMDILRLFDKCGPVASYPNRLIVTDQHNHFEVVALGGGFEGAYTGKDFTVNSIFLNPFSGEILDTVGGAQDIQNKIIRTVEPPATLFNKNPLSIIKVAYLIALLNFKPVGDIILAVQNNLGALKRVSLKDAGNSLEQVFLEHYAPAGVRFLVENGILATLFGSEVNLKSLSAHIAFFHRAQNYSSPLYWAALLHGFPIEKATNLIYKLQLNAKDSDIVQHIIADQRKVPKATRMSVSEIKRFIRRPHFPLSVLLQEALFGERHTKFLRDQLDKYAAASPEDSLFPPKLLSSKDLVKLDLEPGPVFNDILAALEEEQLAGRVRTKEEAKNFVHTYLKN